MGVNIKLWEACQRIIWISRTVTKYPTFDDTSDLYNALLKEVHPNQVDNFYEIVCGKGRDKKDSILNELDCFVDDKYNVYKIVKIDQENDLMEVMVNGSDHAKWSTIDEAIAPILYGMKLIKGKEYYRLLDVLWKNRDGLFLKEKGIKRIDYKKLTINKK